MPNNLFNESPCLTQKQLSSYHLGSISKKEMHVVEEHLIDCELCSMALAGFALVPVSSDEMEQLEKRIDKATRGSGSSFSTLLITGIAAIAITGTFFFYNTAFNNPIDTASKPVMVAENKTETPANVELETKTPVTSIPVDIHDKTVVNKKAESIFPKENFTGNTKDKIVTEVDVVNPVIVEQKIEDKKAQEKSVLKESEEKIVEPEYNAPVRYVLDLKITDYERFYFKEISQQNVPSRNVPAPFENKLSKSMDSEEPLERTQSITDILNKGLMYFKDQNFQRAIQQFSLLIEQNKNDVNALFYSGISFYNLNQNEKALQQLDRVLLSPNNVFEPEALWYKALVLLKKNEKEKAREVLKQVVDEKGFYAKQAKEKLKE